MRRYLFIPALALAPLIAGTVLARPALAKWPPWLSIEAPVNPFDPAVHCGLAQAYRALNDRRAETEAATCQSLK